MGGENLGQAGKIAAVRGKHAGVKAQRAQPRFGFWQFERILVEAEQVAAGQKAVVYGGGESGCEMAEFLAEAGVHVTLVSRSAAKQLARAAEMVYRGELLSRLAANPLITVADNSHIVAVEDGAVRVQTNDGVESRLPMDRLFMAQGRRPANELEAALTERGVFNTLIGDSAQPGRIGDAVHAAYRAVQGLAAEYSMVGHAGF